MHLYSFVLGYRVGCELVGWSQLLRSSLSLEIQIRDNSGKIGSLDDNNTVILLIQHAV